MEVLKGEAVDFNIVTDVAGLNNACYQITHGLYILTASLDKPNGQCIDSLMQVTNAPCRIAIGIGKRSLTYEMISKTATFGVNALDRHDSAWMHKVEHFGFQSGRKVDKFADIPYELGQLGVPILPDAKAFFECRVVPEFSVDLKTHMLYVGAVERAGTRHDGEPLTYNEYRKVRFK